MKLARQAKILELISHEVVDTQEELARRLEESGFKVTQATVSRDIREMKLTKTAGPDGKSRYAARSEEETGLGSKYIRALQNAFVSMDTAQNLLVIHTVQGMAMAAATALDEMQMQEVVGCIAGDNTILCATRSSEDALKVREHIEKMM